ncbi:DUF4476 domain-containing protein [Chitinophaga lutea]|uniref:DUF4476 domain-containing protein n=1 Tax=Chitinophaga lutea TaxID=2488634 RepID=A0A3N4Q3X6_9BACT|nr:DUF4476 domain-containing protein [Chitinophaga lutea]RPE14275.1 DUF4476 domain-containing protein [Chitinophaga lutea]
MDRIKLKLLYLCCCLFFATGLAAQDPSYFVYIQHEKQQPFYVKLNGKLLSSSPKGYVILPRLHAGKVPVTIGFPKNEGPEQQYVIRLTGKRDYGFLLKGTGEKDYALYDLQTFATLKAAGGPVPETEETQVVTVARISSDSATPEQKEMMDKVQADVEAVLTKAPDTAPKKKGGFAEALDKVVVDDRPDDMPLEAPKPKAKPVAPPVETAPVTAAVEEVTEAPVKKARGKKNRSKERASLTDEEKELLSSVLEDEKKAAADEALKTAANEAAPAATPVTEEPAAEPVKKEKKSRKKKDTAEPEFIDFGAAPAAGTAAKAVEKAADVTPVAEEAAGEKSEMSAKEAREARRLKKKAEREAADREAIVKDSLANVEFYGNAEAKEKEEKKPSIKMVNSDCGKVLEVDAFRKLLRTMNSKKKDEDMVDAFRKGTRSVCVSTEQVRALTQLISSEDNRYQLLDAAYPRTYDSQNYNSLGDLLRDDYYKGRFKALIKK